MYSETIDITLPKRPATDKAGKGFSYDIKYKTNRSCNITNTGAGTIKEKVDCNNWNVLPYTANPSKLLTVEGADYFGSDTTRSGNVVLEEVDRKEISTDRTNGGYEITYRLPQTYLETVTGKIYFYNDSNKSLIDGGRKFYTNKFYEKGRLYNLDLALEGLGSYNKWNIKYDCDYSTSRNEFETPTDPDDDPKGYLYPDILFRPIKMR
jgi:hypothetical protein